jgi:hypothetical protein
MWRRTKQARTKQARTKQARTKQARRDCEPCGDCGPCERVLHKHTPLLWRSYVDTRTGPFDSMVLYPVNHVIKI